MLNYGMTQLDDRLSEGVYWILIQLNGTTLSRRLFWTNRSRVTVLALIHDSACAERRGANNGSSLINGRRRRNNVLLHLYSGSTNSPTQLVVVVAT